MGKPQRKPREEQEIVDDLPEPEPLDWVPAEMPRRTPRPVRPEVLEMVERLKEIGIEFTPANAGPDHPFPEPMDVGVSLSDAVVELRREP